MVGMDSMGMELVRMRMSPTLRKPALAEEDGVDSGGVGGEACVLSHQGLYLKLLIRKKTVDDGDDAYVDGDQHGTAAEPRPRQRHGPGGWVGINLGRE